MQKLIIQDCFCLHPWFCLHPCTGSQGNYFGSVGKILKIILSSRVGTSKIKIIDDQGKETCDYESDIISLLCDSINDAKCCEFCFLCSLSKPKTKINDKKKNVYMWNQYYFDLPKIRVGQACTTKN